jgi:hypothetical protein
MCETECVIECRNCDFWYRICGRSYEGECRPTGNKNKKETLFNFSCGRGVPVKSSLTFAGATV